MGWATRHIEELAHGRSVSFRPRGNSMTPLIESGQMCIVAPVTIQEPTVGDIVLCRVNGADYLHLVKAIQGDRVQIGNNKGHVNRWTRRVFGKLLHVAK